LPPLHSFPTLRSSDLALAELTHRDVAGTRRRVADPHAALDQAIEHHEMVELPVQDGRGLEQLDLRDVDLDAAATHAVALGGVEADRKSTRLNSSHLGI